MLLVRDLRSGDHGEATDRVAPGTERHIPDPEERPVSAHDESGDYGYDLAHEVRAALHAPARRRPSPVTGPFGPETDQDGGDLGYDQAHDR